MNRQTTFLLGWSLLLATIGTVSAAAQEPQASSSNATETINREALTQFRFDPAKVKVGTLYHYEKSNIDGTHASHVGLYVASPTRLESLKWSDGRAGATLVAAEIDFETFSVGVFETSRISPSGVETLMGRMTTTDGKLHAKFGPMQSETRIERVPWHSYDFDFASLNFTLRHWQEPEGKLTFGIADFDRRAQPPGFRFKGTVELAFLAAEQRGGQACRKYRLDGPALENRGGFVWVARNGNHVVDFEIELPDEPGYKSNKLSLREVQNLTAEEWAAYKKSRPSSSRGE